MQESQNEDQWEDMSHKVDGKTCWCGDCHDPRFPSK